MNKKFKKALLFYIIPLTIGVGGIVALLTIPTAIDRAKNRAKNDNNHKKNITINMRVPDWNSLQIFDESIYNEQKDSYIRVWEWIDNTKVAKMIPYYIDNTWHIDSTNAYTVGDIMDEINSRKSNTFKFNIDNKLLTGPMGRMLWGVKKSEKTMSKQKDKSHNNYWGINEEKDDSAGWVFRTDIMDDQMYLSLSSPNNEYARSDSHKYFDLNESFFTYDERLSKGIDQIYISSNNILNINLWKII